MSSKNSASILINPKDKWFEINVITTLNKYAWTRLIYSESTNGSRIFAKEHVQLVTLWAKESLRFNNNNKNNNTQINEQTSVSCIMMTLTNLSFLFFWAHSFSHSIFNTRKKLFNHIRRLNISICYLFVQFWCLICTLSITSPIAAL